MRSEQLFAETPAGLRQRLHFARAKLVQFRAGIRGGAVTYSDPLALDVQLLELLWSALSEDERAAAEREFRATHGRCALPSCAWVRAYAQTTPARSS